jgi:hypothetical protein
MIATRCASEAGSVARTDEERDEVFLGDVCVTNLRPNGKSELSGYDRIIHVEPSPDPCVIVIRNMPIILKLRESLCD